MPGWVRSVAKVVFIFFVLLVVAVVSGYVTVLLLVPPENIPVPEVVGKTLDEAIFTLSRSKLSVKVAGKKFSEEIPENVVISQSPAPGIKVREGRTIEVVVSAGGKTAIVPDLKKMKLREAQVYLSQFGIGVKNVSYINCEAPEQEIVAQDPPAGSKITREEGVNLLVSLGSASVKFMMPDLKGMNVKEAAEILKNASLNIAMIKEEASSEKEGTIISQSPPYGSIVDRESRIEIVVSGGEKIAGEIPSYPTKWILTFVKIPLGFGQKEVSVVINDEGGKRKLKWGIYQPGEKVPLSFEVVGKAEVEIYIDDELVRVEKIF